MLGNGRGGVSVSNDGKIGKCYAFNATSSGYLAISDLTINSQSVTLAAWINTNNSHDSNGEYIISINNNAGYVDQAAYIGLESQNLTAGCGGSTAVKLSFNSYSNKWTHVCLVGDTGNQYLYINGNLVDTRTGISSMSKSHITIGARHDAPYSRFVTSKINDVRIYNHALTAEEVRSIVANGLMIHYPLNGMPGDGGNIEYDISGYHNDAEIVGVGKQGLVSSLTAPRYSQSYTNFSLANYIKKSDVAYDSGVWTISCWARSSAQPSAYESIFCLAKTDGEDANKKACICYSPTVNTVWYELENKSGNITGISYAAWHHFVMTCDGSTGKVYIDNELKVTVTGITVRTECHNLGLGCRNENDAFTTGVRPFTTGNLSDFRFYTKCLTADEVAELYNMGAN